ncbi:9767_t:CDS:1, partial [Scutellospora calospora]
MSASEIILNVVNNNKRETPIDGTPISFTNLYCDAWNSIPQKRPTISDIRKRLEGMEPVYDNYQNFKNDGGSILDLTSI